jgi:RNA polymerase sigma-70 factor (ECF subfamily)
VRDEELVLRVGQGDPQALRTLVERWREPLCGYLYRLLGSREDAEDLFQEAFLRVLRHAGRFDPARAFRPWLYSIATNLVRNCYRARGYREAVSLDRADREEETGAPLHARLAGRSPSPSESAAGGEDAARVRLAVEGLPEKGRVALVLFYWQGLAYQEIAEVLEVPLGTVKSRIHNALAQLAQALAEQPLPSEGGREPGL